MPARSKSSSLAYPKLAIPGIVFLLGLLLTLWMQSLISDGALFSSDAGLKAILTQQIAAQIRSGSFPLNVALTVRDSTADWVVQVWNSGLYPVAPPFAYEANGQAFSTFPFLFSLLTAPFYALFGEVGLHIIPVLAMWAIWIRFWQIGLRAAWDAASISLGLFALIFASPLSLYSSTYSEHTLAVALAFWGVSALLYPRKKVLLLRHLPGVRLISSGVLVGLSVWFRPEMLGIAIALSFIVCLGWLLPKWRLITPLSAADVFLFLGSLICTVSIFLAVNYAIYGHVFGLYGLLIANRFDAIAPFQQIKDSYSGLLLGFWRYFPIALLVGVAALCSPEFKRASLKTTNRFKGFKTPNVEKIGIVSLIQNEPLAGRTLMLVGVLLALAAPWLWAIPTGRQWGLGIYLGLVPFLSVVLAEQLKVGFFQNWARRIMLVGTAVALAFGIHMNTLNGAFSLYQDPQTQSTSLLTNYVSMRSIVSELKTTSTPWIAVERQSVAHRLWAALPSKTFFYTRDADALEQLAIALTEQNESEFLFLCESAQRCSVAENGFEGLSLDSGSQLTATLQGQFGRYPLYAITISQ